MYVGAFLIMILGIVYITKTNPTPPTPIINEYYSTVTHQVVEPPKKVIMEEEICTRIDGCRIIENVCVDCLTVKNWWELVTGDDVIDIARNINI